MDGIGALATLVVLAALFYFFRWIRQDRPTLAEDESALPAPRPTPAPQPAPVAVTEPVPEGVFLVNLRDGRKLPMTQGRILIGRAGTNTFVFDDGLVSRKHAEIRHERGKWIIADVGSTNGVFVNHSRVGGDRVLAPEDIIQFGPYALQFLAPVNRATQRLEDQSSTHITLYERIGRGSEATVYKAQRAGDTKYVALKLPHLDSDDKHALDRFRHEIEVAKTLKNEHLVELVEAGDWHDRRPYIAMEYCDGGSLRSKMPIGTPIDEESARQVAAQVARGLGYMHDRGWIHRDTKPENMLLTRDRAVKLGDFGITARVGARAEALGTPHYMSPEQIERRELSARSDLYGLGCVLYEMQAGRCPFEGDKDSVLYSQCHSDPAPLQQQNSRVSPKMNQLVMSLLEKEPRNRPDSAIAVHNFLLA
jgi:tRNA A-37 threonylcarbamoyl transferase component Bud32